MSSYELKRTSDNQFLFNLRAANNEVILTSERYKAKAGAENGIASVRTNSPLEERFERRTSSDNKPYFVLKAANGEIIGRSELYNSTAAMENGIRSVKTNGATAKIIDKTAAAPAPQPPRVSAPAEAAAEAAAAPGPTAPAANPSPPSVLPPSPIYPPQQQPPQQPRPML